MDIIDKEQSIDSLTGIKLDYDYVIWILLAKINDALGRGDVVAYGLLIDQFEHMLYFKKDEQYEKDIEKIETDVEKYVTAQEKKATNPLYAPIVANNIARAEFHKAGFKFRSLMSLAFRTGMLPMDRAGFHE